MMKLFLLAAPEHYDQLLDTKVPDNFAAEMSTAGVFAVIPTDTGNTVRGSGASGGQTAPDADPLTVRKLCCAIVKENKLDGNSIVKTLVRTTQDILMLPFDRPPLDQHPKKISSVLAFT